MDFSNEAFIISVNDTLIVINKLKPDEAISSVYPGKVSRMLSAKVNNMDVIFVAYVKSAYSFLYHT